MKQEIDNLIPHSAGCPKKLGLGDCDCPDRDEAVNAIMELVEKEVKEAMLRQYGYDRRNK